MFLLIVIMVIQNTIRKEDLGHSLNHPPQKIQERSGHSPNHPRQKIQERPGHSPNHPPQKDPTKLFEEGIGVWGYGGSH